MAAPTRLSAIGSRLGAVMGQANGDQSSNAGFQAPADDNGIRGALAINPRYAAYFYGGKRAPQFPVPGDDEPQVPVSKLADQNVAIPQSPNAWKKRPATPDQVKFGGNAPQPLFTVPWNKKFIPPLALFNDASQWVNKLMFNRPMTKFGADTSFSPLPAQYFTPPPIDTSNLSAGRLNLQLQLGNVAIQAARLTTAASDYYG